MVDELQTSLRGRPVQPGDPNYDEVRKLYNAMIDKRPALIVQCRDVADVISAVNFGRDNHMEIAIRSGGHHGAGISLVDDGLVIDLSPMKGIRVDPQAKTVRVKPAAPGAISTMPRMPSARPLPAGSSPRRVWVG